MKRGYFKGMHFWLQVYRDTPSLCVGGAEECAVSAKVVGSCLGDAASY